MQSGSTGKNVNSLENSHLGEVLILSEAAQSYLRTSLVSHSSCFLSPVHISGLLVHDSGRLPLADRSGARSSVIRKHISPVLSDFPPEGGKSYLSPRDKSAAVVTNGMLSPTPTKSLPQAPRMNGGSTSRTSVTRPRFDPMRSFRNSFLGKQAHDRGNPLEDDIPRAKGKEKARAAEDSLERERKNKLSTKAREIREWMKGKSGSEIHHSAIDAIKNLAMGNDETISSPKARQAVGGMRDLFKGRGARSGVPFRDKGPKPGQTYEIVDQQIIENNPDRTVEISTWREQPISKSQTNEDERMSIYFLTSAEFPQEGEFAANITTGQVEWRIDDPDIPPEGVDYTELGIVKSFIADASQIITGTPPQLRRSLTTNIDQPLPLTPGEGILSTRLSERGSSSSAKANKENHVEVTVEYVDMATGSSTSYKGTDQPTPRQRRQYYRPTPIDKELPQSPHEHTPSGSTLSTVKSNSAIHQFEAVLEACEPSLAHIAPLLRNLGIQKVEHLKAVAKLTPWIRDQEVKENALKQGVSVIEWAILLDKLNML